MVNLTNHHRKAIAKVWDSRPIAEVLIEELAIVPASPLPPDPDWQLCTLHRIWFLVDCAACSGRAARARGS
ncbi:MAG: hypothetical protein HYU03_06820 [Thaumarchaeota archaeon]|nr:hypothetical protein [Nitrososphaerota archaeon]